MALQTVTTASETPANPPLLVRVRLYRTNDATFNIAINIILSDLNLSTVLNLSTYLSSLPGFPNTHCINHIKRIT